MAATELQWDHIDGVPWLTMDGELLAAVIKDSACYGCDGRRGLALTRWRVLLERGTRLLPGSWGHPGLAQRAAVNEVRQQLRADQERQRNMDMWASEAKEPRRAS